MSENVKENYSIMFTNYPDIVNIEQMRNMLGEIGVTLADIYNYIEYLFSEGLKPNTIKHQRSILSCIFARVVEQELFEFNFINNLKPIKSDQYISNFYKYDELKELFRIAKSTTIFLEIIIAGVYGLRREEVLGLKWDCIDFTRKTITIKQYAGRINETRIFESYILKTIRR